MKTAIEYQMALEEARNGSLKPVRAAVKSALMHINREMADGLLNPDKFSGTPTFGDKMPHAALHNGSYKDFIRLLSEELSPLGYIVEKSHDGGGMFATYVVKLPVFRSPKSLHSEQVSLALFRRGK